MRFARGLLIFSYGLFTIAAQTLLFREFITAFEGNDISVGIFFGSWFLWIGLGAVLIRRWGRLADALLHHIEFVFLLYIPAFAAQLVLILQVRELAGVASYDLMSVQTIVFWAIAVNAPVSLLTGVLFPVVCCWVERTQAFAVSHVYVLEAVGSFAGGLAVTGLLASHVHAVRVFCLFALVLVCSLVVVGVVDGLARTRMKTRRSRGYHGTMVAVPLLLGVLSLAFVFTRVDAVLVHHLRVLKWKKLLPKGEYGGAFHTAQAEYLCGRYRTQWEVLREGGVCEALPNEAAGQAAAISLCQVPQARRVLVVGSGLALCHRFLELPLITEVAWAHPDTEYVTRVPDLAPDEFGIDDERFRPVTREIRGYLSETQHRFDIVVLSLPDVTNSVLNRYFTLEFYKQIEAALQAGGVLSVSVAGGENVLGAELISLGASVKTTLERVFSNLVLVPGDETWFIASDSKQLTGDPATLRDRFAGIEGAEGIFPPTGLMSVYLPDRAARAVELYDKADLPEDRLVNRDARPLTHLYGLLLAARQSGASVTRFVKLLVLGGWLAFLVPILVFVALRAWAISKEGVAERRSSFDSCFLVFSTGWVSIGSMIVVMYLYQTHFGSLYLHVGVISSLFMAGLTVGAVVISHVVAWEGRTEPATEGSPYKLPMAVLLIHGLVLAAMAWWFAGAPVGTTASLGHGAFAMVFALLGLCCGGYWPIAAGQLARSGFSAAEAGSRLETADHLGACFGGLAVSLLMVPVLGSRATLLVLVALVLANVPAAALMWWRRGAVTGVPDEMPSATRVGYVLFGVAATVVVGSNILTAAGARLRPNLPDYAVQSLAGERQAQEAAAVLTDSGKPVRYFRLPETEEHRTAYVFSSADFAPAVRGFGGKINLAVRLDEAGTLRDFLIVQSNETPSYLELLRDWLEGLKGRDLFSAEPFAEVHSVTGATVSSEAVLASLEQSAAGFAQHVLGRDAAATTGGPAKQTPVWARYLPAPAALYLMGASAAAVLVTLWGGFWSRLIVLVLSLVIGGVILNVQYSTEQVATLLSLQVPALRPAGALLLVVGVPLLVVLFGNVYCGYICPFGAAQELLGYVLPQRRKPPLIRREMQAGRFIKYVVLFVLVAAFFLSRNRTTLAGDPLISVFAFQPSIGSLREAVAGWPHWMLAVVGVALVGSLLFVRFWCRYLCPAGAFLSLLNHLVLLKRRLPAKRFGRCEFGLTVQDHLDCIYCDRCRYPAKAGALPRRDGAPRAGEALVWVRPFVAAVLVVGVFVVGVSLRRFRRVLPEFLQEPVAAVGAGGQPRDVDAQRIETLIEQGRLSDKEAQYYKKVEPEPSGDTTLNDESNGSPKGGGSG